MAEATIAILIPSCHIKKKKIVKHVPKDVNNVVLKSMSACEHNTESRGRLCVSLP